MKTRPEKETTPAPATISPALPDVPEYVDAAIRRWLDEERDRLDGVDRLVLEVAR